MMKQVSLLFVVFINATILFGQVPKGDRILAWQVDMAENNNYDSAFAYAKVACMESIHLSYTWGLLEDSFNVFNTTYMNATLSVADIYYPANGMKVELQIAPLNTGTLEVPADLETNNFDDQVMIDRFKTLLDTIFSRIPNLELSALNIGNEHDVNFGIDVAQYDAYKVFLDSVIPYAKQLYFNLHSSDLKVGTTFTLHSLTNPLTSALCQSVNAACDIITTTYYPLNPDFTMQTPSAVFTDFNDLTAIYNDPNVPIYFAECGYSSSSVCNSSEQLQATFYKNVFEAWDTHYDQIKYLTLFKTTDWSQSDVDLLSQYYGLGNNTEFKEYLRALGVRTFPGNGSNKAAYLQILCELSNRNWCQVTCPPLSIENVDNSDGLKLNIYPNPCDQYFSIQSADNDIVMQVELFDRSGRKIRSLSSIAVDSKIDISYLMSSVYLVRITSEEKVLIKKLIVD